MFGIPMLCVRDKEKQVATKKEINNHKVLISYQRLSG